MKIEKLSECSVKITLSKNDLCEYNIRYDSWDSDITADFLLSVCDEIKAKTGRDISNEKLYVEIFSRTSGCQIFISYPPSVKPESPDAYCIMCDFFDFGSLRDFCRDIMLLFPKSVRNSGLYYSSRILRIIMSVQAKYEEDILMLAKNCHANRCNEVAYAATSEYYRCILGEEAVRKIAKINP